MQSANPNRRSFLAAAASSRAFGANDQIGMGFIGAGIRGAYLLDSFRAVSGVRPAAKEAAGGDILTTRDYQEVLARKDIDAVAIATPDHWRHRMTLDALAAGKHVYIEKPLTWSIEQGQDLMAAEKRSGKLVMVGSGGKTPAVTAKVRQVVKSGVLGKVNMVGHDSCLVLLAGRRFGGWTSRETYPTTRRIPRRDTYPGCGDAALCTLHEMLDVVGPKSVVSQGGIYRWNDGRTAP
jgi:predicted dehydrogenase